MIETLLVLTAAYLAAGLLFALVFQVAGLRRVDPATEGAGLVVRLLITPGLAALWPWMLVRWRRAAAGGDPSGAAERPVSPRGLRTGHRRLVWTVLLVIPVLALVTLVHRPSPPERTAAPQLFEALAGGRSAGVVIERSDVIESSDRPFGGLPLRLEVRAEETGARSVLLRVTEDLELPALGLYFAAEVPAGEVPAGGAPGQVPAGAAFLGAVYGPAELGFELPAGTGGSLWLYSLARREVVAHHVLGSGR